MFRTTTADQAGLTGMFGEGLAHFHAVSRSLATHWYHVSLKRRHEGRFVSQEEMLNDEPRLVELLTAQGEDLVVHEVQVVTPARMNKRSGWRMEKLRTLSMGFDRADVPVCVVEVESGDVYVDAHDPEFDVESLKGLKQLYRCASSQPLCDQAVSRDA